MMDNFNRATLFKFLLPTLISGVIALLCWSLRAQYYGAENPETHWLKIYQSEEQYQAIALGDSRIATGISPYEFKESNLLNFAFTNACYSEAYLSNAEKRMKPEGSYRYFILGLGPYNLSKKSCKLSGFEKRHEENTRLNPIMQAFQSFSFFMRPYRSSHFQAVGKKEAVNQLIYHDNGWLAAHNMEDGFEAMNFRNLVRDNEASPEITEALVAWTQRQTAAGVTVFFVYPPTGDEQLKTEIMLKDFLATKITDRLKNAGAHQFIMPSDFLRNAQYDGVHLREEKAILWSRYLATQIKSYFAAKENAHSSSK